MDDTEREAFVNAYKVKNAELESALAAAWVKENAPDAGEDGSPCEGGNSSSDSLVDSLIGAVAREYGKCTKETQCCGDLTNKADNTIKMENVCVDKTALAYTDVLGREFEHKCLAAKLFAAAAAAASLATSLM